jgi:hypothetical protein
MPDRVQGIGSAGSVLDMDDDEAGELSSVGEATVSQTFMIKGDAHELRQLQQAAYTYIVLLSLPTEKLQHILYVRRAVIRKLALDFEHLRRICLIA